MTKSLGQNFLINETIVNSIVSKAQVTANDLVIEIGTGVGSMTVALAKSAGKVVTVEIDKYLIPALQEVLSPFSNIALIHDDALKVNFNQVIQDAKQSGLQSVKVIANLPYYITTPIIMRFLEEIKDIDSMLFMVQKEVADRMCAKSGTKEYGALSVAVQYYTIPQVILNVPPHCFLPQPDVHSSVIQLNTYQNPPVKLQDEKYFFRVVKAAFAQRRKTLQNTLFNTGGFTLTKDEITKILHECGIQEKQRGETLDLQQFALLANALHRNKMKSKEV